MAPIFLRGRLGLAVTVPDGKAPGVAYPRDHLRVERLAGATYLTQGHPPGFEILLDQLPPDGRRRTKRRHRATFQHSEQDLGIEARLVDHEDRRAGIPRREPIGTRVTVRVTVPSGGSLHADGNTHESVVDDDIGLCHVPRGRAS